VGSDIRGSVVTFLNFNENLVLHLVLCCSFHLCGAPDLGAGS
jgi:hypothetical protein